MTHEIVFGVPLFRYYLDPTELKSKALKKFEQTRGFPIHETPGGWDCELQTDFDNSMANLYHHHYDDIMAQFTKDVGLKEGAAMIHESWVNCYGKGHNQEEHDHLPSFYSGIHYIKYNPEVHEAVHFLNPLFQLYNCTYTLSSQVCRGDNALQEHPFSRQWMLPEVKEGDIILFPSFIRHRVNKQETEELRITASFNINTIKGSTRRVFSQ